MAKYNVVAKNKVLEKAGFNFFKIQNALYSSSKHKDISASNAKILDANDYILNEIEKFTLEFMSEIIHKFDLPTYAREFKTSKRDVLANLFEKSIYTISNTLNKNIITSGKHHKNIMKASEIYDKKIIDLENRLINEIKEKFVEKS